MLLNHLHQLPHANARRGTVSDLKTPAGLSLAHEYVPPIVRRVHTPNGGSHVEPPLQQQWSNLEKLRWLAASIESENPGVTIRVGDGRNWSGKRFIHGTYDIHVKSEKFSSHGGAGSYDLAWWQLNGIKTGLQAGRASNAPT